MKRSKMLEILKMYFIGYDNCDSIIERALHIVEENGMLPPAIVVEKLTNEVKSVDKSACTMTIGTTYSIGYENKWESENET